MKGLFKQVVTCVITFALVLCILLFLLVATSFIPKKAIQENMQESAGYLCERSSTFLIRDFLHASVIDHYADSITLSIAYYLDGEHPLESAMWTSFYGAASSRMNEFFLESVNSVVEPNHEYLRYWHGSAGIMRFLHQFWNIQQIYILHAILMAFLYILLMVLLYKNHMLPEAAAFTFSMILISVWYVPLCLEYTWMFLVMLVASIPAVWLAVHKQYEHIGLFFMVTGMVAAYLDFLTTETLTLLIPLLFILRIRSRQGESHNWKLTIKCCALWLIGFAGMWAAKWALASVVLNQNVMPLVTGHVVERLEGEVAREQSNFILAAIVRNLKCLFPYEYGISGAILVFAFVVVAVVLPIAWNKVRLKETINSKIIPIYALLGLVPFIRYAVMRNHSYIHFFFTHRALAGTVLAICFILLELLEKVPRKAVKQNA